MVDNDANRRALQVRSFAICTGTYTCGLYAEAPVCRTSVYMARYLMCLAYERVNAVRSAICKLSTYCVRSIQCLPGSHLMSTTLIPVSGSHEWHVPF